MTTEDQDEISAKRELSRRRFLRNAGAAASVPLLAGVADILSESGSRRETYKRNNDHPFFASHPKYHFVMDNHVTTNSFFTATIYGCQDSCALTGYSFSWIGSTNSVVSEMVSAMDSAIASKANGIGVPLIDNTAFNGPVDKALNAGIPVIAYNADVGPGFVNNRMAYVGQYNLTAGAAVATHILEHGVPTREGRPRRRHHRHSGHGQHPAADRRREASLQGGRHRLRGGRDLGHRRLAGVQHDLVLVRRPQGREVHDDRRQRRQRRGRASSSSTNKLKGKVGGSGWDTGLPVMDAINTGSLLQTVDQQAYLQGFDTLMQLFLFNISGGLMKPTDTDTGTAIVVKATVGPYLRPTGGRARPARRRFQAAAQAIPY